MLTTLLLTIIIILVCVVLLSVKVLFKKGGEFPNTHVGGNKALSRKGIHCAKTQYRETLAHKNLEERLNEIEI
ncbi:MAG: hypothetical protein LBL58_09545 [Tannerellaceae bacterium]|jgi:hypothetical protein|nr:hypothetical protein [Tannerellaceae bacterium]